MGENAVDEGNRKFESRLTSYELIVRSNNDILSNMKWLKISLIIGNRYSYSQL